MNEQQIIKRLKDARGHLMDVGNMRLLSNDRTESLQLYRMDTGHYAVRYERVK